MEAGINVDVGRYLHMKSINMEAGFCFCGGWNFSKLVIVDATFIREMRVQCNPDLVTSYLVTNPDLVTILQKTIFLVHKNISFSDNLVFSAPSI